MNFRNRAYILFFACMTVISMSNAKKLNPKFIKKDSTEIDNPFELRDPFVRKIKRKRSIGPTSPETSSNFSNVPSIDNVSLDRIMIVGVLTGERRRAIARVTDENGKLNEKDVFFLKEGMKLGENKAEIKAILPGGIVLVEKIRNVYDQDEYLETIIPVSQK